MCKFGRGGMRVTIFDGGQVRCDTVMGSHMNLVGWGVCDNFAKGQE